MTLEIAHPWQGTNAGHAHVWKRPDHQRHHCGGLHMCSQCQADKAKVDDWIAKHVPAGLIYDPAAPTDPRVADTIAFLREKVANCPTCEGAAELDLNARAKASCPTCKPYRETLARLEGEDRSPI